MRGVITAGETQSRFSLGVVGGVAREAVSLVGTVGQLGTTVTEMQLSREASAEYGEKIASAVGSAATATGNYASAVADDPSRLGRDLDSAADAGGDWVGDQVSRYDQAIREGRGAETIGMDVGAVAANLVPIGGGPVRGIATTALREGGEAIAREGVETLVREGGEAVVRQGTEAVVREGTEAGVRQGGEAVAREGGEAAAREGGEAAARDAATASTPESATPAVPAGAPTAVTSAAAAVTDRGVYFFNQNVLQYIDKADATLSRAGSSHFFMPVEDSALVIDRASAYRYTGGAPSLEEAYKLNLDVYGVDFPIAGLPTRLPTAADTNLPHFLEGGNTALRLGDNGGFLINPTREFVTPGGVAMPEGSVLFRLEEGGARTTIRTW